MKQLLSAVFILLTIGTTLLHAIVFDTTLHAFGSAGPYVITHRFIDTAELQVRLSPDSLIPDTVEYTIIPEMNGLLFSRSLESGVRIHVRTQIEYYGLSTRYHRFTPIYTYKTDSLDFAQQFSPMRSAGDTPQSQLTLSGYKSVGIALGNMGQSNISQGIDVRVFGDVGEQTQVSGHITDQGTSIGNVTREVNELDRIYLTITHPHYTATVGDQYLEWMPQGLIYNKKKIKGISASYTPNNGLIKGFGTVTKGEHMVVTFRGENNMQGPYYLRTRTGDPSLSLISGTIRVIVNGTQLEQRSQYTVDHEFGSITFTPSFPISRHDVIRVEYEYTKNDYLRYCSGTRTSLSTRDSSLTVQGVLWNESDNKNAPLTLSLGPHDRDSLSRYGDSTWYRPAGDYIDPAAIDSAAAYSKLYYRSDSGFIWAGPVHNLRRDKKLYALSFTRDFNGSYVQDTVCPGETVRIRDRTVSAIDSCLHFFRPVGTGKGTHALTKQALTPPQRATTGEIRLSLTPGPHFSTHADILGRARDKNLYSSLHDDDNTAGAAVVGFNAGKKRTDTFALWAGAEGFVRSRNMQQSLRHGWRQNIEWDDTSLTRTRRQQKSLQVYGGITPVPGLQTSLRGGILTQDNDPVTEKVTSAIGYFLSDKDSLFHTLSLFRHLRSDEISRKQRAGFTIHGSRLTLSLQGHEQWRRGPRYRHYGRAGGLCNVHLTRVDLSQTLDYRVHKTGTGSILSAQDTGYTFIWQQEIAHDPLPFWNLSATSSHLRDVIYSPQRRDISTLVQLTSDILPLQWGFSGSQKYSVTVERASRVVQEAYFVGQGLGDYELDSTSTTQSFIPREGGAWVVTQREYSGPGISRNTRKSMLQINWRLKPEYVDSGILADMHFSGSGKIEEQIQLQPQPPVRSWIPGAMSLARSLDTSLYASRCHYRQTLQWFPSPAPAWSLRLTITPSITISPGYNESQLHTEPQLRRRKEHLLLHAGLSFFSLAHSPRPTAYGAPYEVNEQSLSLKQRYSLDNGIQLHISEQGGRTHKQETGWFARITPGLDWQMNDNGWLRAEYTIAWVNADNSLDYRQAGGYRKGLTQVINAMMQYRTRKDHSLHGSYRAEFSRHFPSYGLHTLSTEFRMRF